MVVRLIGYASLPAQKSTASVILGEAECEIFILLNGCVENGKGRGA